MIKFIIVVPIVFMLGALVWLFWSRYRETHVTISKKWRFFKDDDDDLF